MPVLCLKLHLLANLPSTKLCISFQYISFCSAICVPSTKLYLNVTKPAVILLSANHNTRIKSLYSFQEITSIYTYVSVLHV